MLTNMDRALIASIMEQVETWESECRGAFIEDLLGKLSTEQLQAVHDEVWMGEDEDEEESEDE